MKMEPGSPSAFTLKEYKDMSISELVSVMRVSFKVNVFDEIEEELSRREAAVRVDIGALREKIEVERLKRIEAEVKLKTRDEQCRKGKRTQESYELLLKEVKKNGLNKDTVEELKKKNLALERQISQLKKSEQKWLENAESMAQLEANIKALEADKVRDKNALTMKNTELGEQIEKNLMVIEELRTQKQKMTNVNQSLTKKFKDLSERVAKMEDDMSCFLDASDIEEEGEADPDHGVTCAVKDDVDLNDCKDLQNDNGGDVPVPRNEDTHHSLHAATAQSPTKRSKEPLSASTSGVKFRGGIEIIILDGEDDDDHPQVKLENDAEEQRSIERSKRRRFSDIGTSTSTSTSTSSGDALNLHINNVLREAKLRRIVLD